MVMQQRKYSNQKKQLLLRNLLIQVSQEKQRKNKALQECYATFSTNYSFFNCIITDNTDPSVLQESNYRAIFPKLLRIYSIHFACALLQIRGDRAMQSAMIAGLTPSGAFRIVLALCKSRTSEHDANVRARRQASERRGASLVSPGALSPFHGLRSYRKKRPPLAVTVCRQNLPFRLAFSTCENKNLSRFSYRSGERPQEWQRDGGQREKAQSG